MSLPLYDVLDESRDLALTDNLRNLVTGMGTHKDKGAHGRFEHRWLDWAQIEAMYSNDWIAGAAVDAVADDMTREWRVWHGGERQVAGMVKAERDFDVRGRVNRALKQSRAYGGAGILIGDGSSNPELELDIDRLPKGGLRYLHNLSRYELTSGPLCRDPASLYFGQPDYYLLAAPSIESGVQIHPSRVIPFIGVPRLEASRSLDAWGDSILQRIYDAVRNAASTSQALAALVQEAKVDVVKIEDLTEKSVDEGWRTQMLARLALANQGKSISGMLLLDKLEEYTQKQISLAELPKVLMAFLEVCAGAAGMPVTRLLGRSPGGLGSNGSGEIRHYYDTCSSKQETDLRGPLNRLDRVLKRHALGATPEKLDYRWVPLWQLTESEKAAVALQKAQATQVLLATGLVPFAALAVSVQSQVAADGTYPGFEAALAVEIAAGRQVKQPPAPVDDGSKVKNPAINSAPVADGRIAPRTLFVKRAVLNAADIVAWADAQGFRGILDASDMHATIAYSKRAMDWSAVNPDAPSVVVPASKRTRSVKPLGDKGAVVLRFASPVLAARWQEFVEAGASWDHDGFQPHVTLTYAAGDIDLSKVEPYGGPIEFGPEIFAEVDPNWAPKSKDAS